MKEQLISFDTAKLAKEKGFNVPTENKYLPSGECIHILKNQIVEDNENFTFDRGSLWEYIEKGYLKNLLKLCTPSLDNVWITDDLKHCEYLAPTQSILHKWLRDTHNIDIDIGTDYHRESKWYEVYIWEDDRGDYIEGEEKDSIFSFENYEQALEAGLLKALIKI